MYDRMNEEVMWQRLVDLQRESEYSALLASRTGEAARGLLSALRTGLRRLAGVVFEPDRRAWVDGGGTESTTSEDVA